MTTSADNMTIITANFNTIIEYIRESLKDISKIIVEHETTYTRPRGQTGPKKQTGLDTIQADETTIGPVCSPGPVCTQVPYMVTLWSIPYTLSFDSTRRFRFDLRYTVEGSRITLYIIYNQYDTIHLNTIENFHVAIDIILNRIKTSRALLYNCVEYLNTQFKLIENKKSNALTFVKNSKYEITLDTDVDYIKYYVGNLCLFINNTKLISITVYSMIEVEHFAQLIRTSDYSSHLC